MARHSGISGLSTRDPRVMLPIAHLAALQLTSFLLERAVFARDLETRLAVHVSVVYSQAISISHWTGLSSLRFQLRLYVKLGCLAFLLIVYYGDRSPAFLFWPTRIFQSLLCILVWGAPVLWHATTITVSAIVVRFLCNTQARLARRKSVELVAMLADEVRPFRGSNERQIIAPLIDDNSDAAPVRRLNSAVSRDLEIICLKALSKERAWQTAAIPPQAQRKRFNSRPLTTHAFIHRNRASAGGGRIADKRSLYC